MYSSRPAKALAATGLAALVLSACGTSADEPAPEAPDEIDWSDVSGSITVWTWDGAPGVAIMDELGAAFEEATGVVVESRVISREDYTSQVQLSLNSGESIDVLGVQPSRFAAEVQGQLIPVSAYESSLAGGLEAYDDAALEQLSVLYDGDELYSVPLGSTGSAVCFYNADILDAAGVDDPPATWEDVRALTEALEELDSGILTLVKPSGADGQWFEDEFLLTMVGQLDPDFFNELRYGDGGWDTPAYREALERYGTLYEEGTLQRSALDLGYADAMNAFNTGRAAIVCNGTWEAALLKEEFRTENQIDASVVGVIPVPADDPDTRSLRSFLDITWGIPDTGTNPAAAAAFISFATQGEGVDIWAGGLGFVPNVEGWELDTAVFDGDEVAQAGYEIIQELIANPSSHRNNLSSLSDQVGIHVQEVAHGRMTAEEAASRAQADFDSGLYD